MAVPPKIRRAEPGRPALHILADLDIEVGDAHGRTDAHLGDDGGGLVLDIGDPAVMRRAFPRPHLVAQAPRPTSDERPPATTLRLRSAGRDLGRLYVRPGSPTRVRPTAAGAIVAARTALAARRNSALAVVVSVTAAALVVATRAWGAPDPRRSHRASRPPLPDR